MGRGNKLNLFSMYLGHFYSYHCLLGTTDLVKVLVKKKKEMAEEYLQRNGKEHNIISLLNMNCIYFFSFS